VSSRVNRVEKLIINLDTTLPMVCGWDECDRRARTSYQVRLHEHPRVSCTAVNEAGGELGRHAHFAFCSERHLMYWVNATGTHAHESAARNQGRIYGQLPAGMRGGR
jgi:hypothetical protein